nr:reverse transcriptase family protein [uncultured Carboxylicivirga sp.]
MKKRIKDLAFALKINKDELLDLAMQLDLAESKLYNSWDEPKKDENGNPKYLDGILQTRPINAPIKRLKNIQSKILKKALYSFKLPDYFYGGIKGKDAVLNAKVHQGNKYFFQTDLKDFYPSIHCAVVEETLRKMGFYPDVSRLITRLSTKAGALPQGCPTSSYMAALVVYFNTNDLLQKYITQNLKVTIYVDDLTISSPIDFKDRSVIILQELRQRGLKINFDKTRYYSKNPLVTGVVVKNNGITAPKISFIKSRDLSLSENSRKGHQMRIDYIKRIAKKK